MLIATHYADNARLTFVRTPTSLQLERRQTAITQISWNFSMNWQSLRCQIFSNDEVTLSTNFRNYYRIFPILPGHFPEAG